MARVAVLNPRKRRRKTTSRKRKTTTRRRTSSRRRTTRRRRRNPVATTRARTTTRRSSYRPRRRRTTRRNPIGLGKIMGRGLLGDLFAATVGYFGAKAADYFNGGWTTNVTSAVPAWREPVKDAAATGAALAVPQVLKMTGMLKGSAVRSASVGGLLYALNRGLSARARAKGFPSGSFAGHLLGDGGMGDYVMADGSDLFTDDLLGDDELLALLDDDGDLGDYEYADGGFDDVLDVEVL